MKVILQAITAEGFGGESVYTESCVVNTDEELERARINFALKYNVQLDNVLVAKEI